MSGAEAILRWHLSTLPCPPPRSPRSRSAGEGPGVRAALTFPPTPFLSPMGSGRGRVGRERMNAEHPSRNGHTGSVRA